ncbi:MAG: aldo/keto reductase [Oscillospiraceae bacterium]|jgi:predicted aldo/keto reductase-like oxidoreductase|nr:aldo/keto reductase [Oscillospiraceae bacterium]
MSEKSIGKYLGESIPKLGFGFMRLPRADGDSGGGGFGGFGAPPKFDMPQIEKMVDYFLDNGFTYFDTAFVYQGSEEAMREALVKRHPDRESYQIASKLNLMAIQNRSLEGLKQEFETTMERLGTPYLDFYLLHGLGGPSIASAEELGAWDYLKELKAAGKIRHAGLSFHGTPEELDELLTKHPEAEFVQLQINYLDWENPQVQSRRLYETARAHNTPITVMEPIKGGQLASEASVFGEALKRSAPDVSVASWALRYVASLDGLITILSGMSTYEQLVDNVKTFKNIQKLSGDDRKLLDAAVATINSVPSVPCTRCNYCSPNCPQKINIPALIGLYNDYLVYRSAEGISRSYGFMAMQGGKAKDCIACKTCEEHCPQHIEIADTIAKLSPLVD